MASIPKNCKPFEEYRHHDIDDYINTGFLSLNVLTQEIEEDISNNKNYLLENIQNVYDELIEQGKHRSRVIVDVSVETERGEWDSHYVITYRGYEKKTEAEIKRDKRNAEKAAKKRAEEKLKKEARELKELKRLQEKFGTSH